MDEALFQSYLLHPERFKEHVLAQGNEWIVVDEIERLPALLNYVHQLIETKKFKFVLTGLSARKLKNHSTNFLGGRASLKKFLEAMAFSQGQIINAISVASNVGVDRKTVESYLQILEDLMLAYRLPVFQKKAKRKMSSKPKFYYFDVGVYRTLRKIGPLDVEEEIDGAALETLVLQNLKAIIENKNYAADIFFYQTQSKIEVDFVLYGEGLFCAIEVKRSDQIKSNDLNGLHTFKSDYPQAKLFLFSMEKEARTTEDGIRIINLEYALKNIDKLVFGLN